MIRRIGIVLMAAGVLGVMSGAIWHLVPTPDANIGAGLLLLGGAPVAGAGVVLLLVSLLLRRPSRPSR